MVYISGVNYESFNDFEGVTCVIFVSGCQHSCPFCQNPETWDFNYGVPLTEELINTINQEIDKRPFLNAMVLSGGDPMYSAKELINWIPKLHIPNNNLVCFSGFTYEEIQQDKDMEALLGYCNVLIDGRFEIEKRDTTLPFCGSSNQRIWRKTDDKWSN